MLFFEECLRETLYFQKNILSLFITDFGHPNLIILILFWLVPRRTYHGTASTELWCWFPLWARDCSLHPTFLGPLICKRLLYITTPSSRSTIQHLRCVGRWPTAWSLSAIQQSRTQVTAPVSLRTCYHLFINLLSRFLIPADARSWRMYQGKVG